MKPFHKQRLVTRVLFSWGGGGVVYNKFLKIFVSPQGPANKDWGPVCCFLGGGCLQQILKDICFSPGACKQRLGTRVLFSWGGGCLQQILKDICFSPGACKQRLGTRVLFSWGGVVYNKFLKIFVSPQGPANKDWEPVCCFGGGGGGRTSPKQLENRKL